MFFKRESLDDSGVLTASIYKDYLHSFSSLSSYYGGDYRDISSFSSFMETNNITAEQRFNLVSRIEEYNRSYNYSSEVFASIEKLKGSSCFTVVAGQQPGLLTGPLYTIYKAISAIKLSEDLSNYFGSGFNFVPIFWVASEDHDLGEVNRFTHQLASGDLQSSSLNLEYSGKTLDSVGLADEFSIFLGGLNFPKTAFSESLFSLLSSSGRGSFSKHFVHLLSEFFKDKGLIIVEPYIFRDMSVSLNRFVIERREDLLYALRESSVSLEGADYEVQIDYRTLLDRTSGGKWTLLFYLEEAQRKKLYCNGDNFRLGDRVLSREELFGKFADEPYKFSHSVVLRPIVQDILFPNIGTIAGPGEIAYFAQLKGLYRIFARSMPIVYPRLSISLLEKKIARIKERFSFSMEDILANNLADKAEEVFSKLDIEGLDIFVSQIRSALEGILEEAGKQGSEIQESINPSIKKIEYELKRLRQRFIKKSEDREGISRKQLEKLKNALLPKGKLQERVFSIVTYANLYGDSLIEEIMQMVDIREFSHQVLYYD